VDRKSYHQRSTSARLSCPAWQKLMRKHKALFNRTYDKPDTRGLSHIQTINSIFKRDDQEYKASKGKAIFDQIEEIQKQMDSDIRSRLTPDFKEKEWHRFKRRYYKKFEQER